MNPMYEILKLCIQEKLMNFDCLEVGFSLFNILIKLSFVRFYKDLYGGSGDKLAWDTTICNG